MWQEKSKLFFFFQIWQHQVFSSFQLTELCCLRDDLRQLMGIAQQLEPYIKSITSLMEQIQPEVGAAAPSAPPPPPPPSGGEASGSSMATMPPAMPISMASKGTQYSHHGGGAGGRTGSQAAHGVTPGPPANFTKQLLATEAALAGIPHHLPERIQAAVSLAEYKSRYELKF